MGPTEHTHRQTLAIRRTLWGAVATPLALALVLAVLLLLQITEFRRATRWIDHTDRVIARANLVQKTMIDAETGLRGYLLFRDADFLEPYSKSREVMPGLLGDLGRGIQDNTAQRARVQSLVAGIAQWNRDAEATVAQREHGADAVSVPEARERKRTMDSLRGQFSEFIDIEEALRTERVGRAEADARMLFGLVVTVTAVFGAALGWFIRRRIVGIAETYEAIVEETVRQTDALRVAADERTVLLADERRARAHAEEASRLKDEFLATVSHELRTPLTSILGWARMLRMGTVKPEKYAKALETIERNAKSQAQLVEDLLDISRAIEGKLRLDVRSVDLAVVVRDAVETMRPAAEARDVQLDVIVDPNAGPVAGDPDRIQQVVWNLVSNAIKFTPRRGRILVKLQRAESSVEITVEDNGAGISGVFLPYVFDRFRQAEGAITRTHQGLGLGLAIVKHLVELHGGTVRAESEGEGKGSRFTVRLPLSPVRPSAEDVPTVHPSRDRVIPPERVSLTGVRVLVVDDEADSREMLSVLLQSLGATVTTAANVTDALTEFHRAPPDLLVSDIGMPGQDGYALVRAVRALPASEGGRTPAVALTAYARVEDRTRSLREGFTVHVAKPVEPAELAVVVAHAVGRLGPPVAAA